MPPTYVSFFQLRSNNGQIIATILFRIRLWRVNFSCLLTGFYLVIVDDKAVRLSSHPPSLERIPSAAMTGHTIGMFLSNFQISVIEGIFWFVSAM